MKNTLLIALLIFTNLANASNKKHSHFHHHSFSDSKKWSKIFEDPKRDSWQRPNLVMDRLKITERMKIADIGSATGYFPVRLAKRVSNGRVWGVDIEPNLVRYLNERASKEKINNLFSILALKNDPLIPEKVDLIIIVDTYHHIGKRVHYLKGLKKYLTPKGRIAIVDFKKGKLPFGPKDHMKLSPKSVEKEFSKAGYLMKNKFEDLKYQYLLVFQMS